MRYGFVLLTVVFLSIVFPIYPQFNENTVLHMEKTSCRGPCPVYKITLLKNRTMLYEGINNVDLAGSYYKKIRKKEFKSLVTLMLENNFFDFDNKYISDLSDMPTTYIYFNYNDKQKFITDYYGAPRELKEIEEYISGYLDRLKWKKIKSP